MTRCRSLKDKNRQGNYGVVPTVRVLNSAFIADPENPRRVHYCQPKSAARALIYRDVITACNSFRRKTSCETTGHIRRNIMASISKPDYDDFEPAEKRVLMETLAVEYGAGLDTLRRTIQRNRVKSIPSLVMGNIDTSKYRCVTDGEHLLLKDDDNMILVAICSLFNNIFVILNLVNLFGDGRVKQIPEEVQGTGSSQLYTPLRGQAPLIPHDVKLITDFEIQAIDAIKSTLGVEVLGYEMNSKGISGCGTSFQRLQNAIVYATTSCWAIECFGATEDSSY
uniref:HTH psq-type domain-containing protein n=1 Tax=Heterorhabditis bacteriophora TaxID=37862 RepID=A0A1I7XNA6_HETBA